MKSEDEQFEDFLRQFRPRRPRALPGSVRASRLQWGAAAAAAAGIATAAWLALGQAGPVSGPAGTVPVQQVSRQSGGARAAVIAGWDVDALDRMLIEMSPRVLPDVERPDSSLHPLAGY